MDTDAGPNKNARDWSNAPEYTVPTLFGRWYEQYGLRWNSAVTLDRRVVIAWHLLSQLFRRC